MRVYEILNNYIKDNGIKQSYIAEKTGIPENTLSMILNGKVKLDADKLVLIVRVLNIDPNIIIQATLNEISDTN